MTLLDLEEGSVAEVIALRGPGMAERLQALGFYRGSMIRLVRAAPFGGPVMIEDVASGARIMIGRGMAGGIEVGDGDPARS